MMSQVYRYHGYHCDIDVAEAVEVARAYLSLLDNPAARVGELVRPLVWQERVNGFSHPFWLAESQFGFYQCGKQRTDGRWWSQGPLSGGYHEIHDDGCLEAAKAACELDYQNRVAQLLKGEG
jgi:hypothetical protein